MHPAGTRALGLSIGLGLLLHTPARGDDGLAPARVPSAAERARLAEKEPKSDRERQYLYMSTPGAVAAGIAPITDMIAAPEEQGAARTGPQAVAPAPAGRPAPLSPTAIGGTDVIVHSPGALGFQSETSIAANTDGSVLIAGYNDSRGFPAGPVTPGTTPLSLSGVARSLDGGITWSEVPVGPGGSGTIPCGASGELYGDPDVKYDPTRNIFVYSSIYLRPGDGLQGLSINTSNADGSAWSNPIAIAPSFVSGHAADKEFIDINPATGRILVTWTDFGSASNRIRASFSDNLGTTWSPATTLETSTATIGVQGSMPRFLPGTTNANSTAYCVWNGTTTTGGITTQNERMSRSVDGGVSWSVAVSVDSLSFNAEDQILGVDRVNSFPAMAIDYTSGRVYVVYQRNNSTGEGDIALRTFIGPPVTGAPVLIDSNPGNDRAQFLPAVTVDQTSRRVHVVWYDQDVVPTGDVTQVMRTSSTDGGTTWSRPVPVTDRPFHAGYGNDTSEPNLGDYNQIVSSGDVLFALWGGTSVAPRFDEGQPSSASMITPDTYGDHTPASTAIAALRLGTASFTESNCASGGNGHLDPGEAGDFTFPLTNYVLNPIASPITYTGISATLTTSTAGVTIPVATASYPNAASGATVSNTTAFRVQVDPAFVAGTYIDLVLTVTTTQGESIALPYRLATGTPGTPTSLLNESFNTTTITVSQTPPTSVWASVRGGTTSAGAFTVAQTLTPGNNAAYMSESSTGAEGWIRLWSPYITVPSPSGESYVTLDFDLVYNLENEPTKSVEAYDGLTLRITDQTTGSTVRSVLTEAFAESIVTGAVNHFPKHTVRSNAANYFADMSVWSGNSGGTKHVSMRFPGTGMVGRTVQLRFEYTQDASGVCATGTCGVAIDNIVMNLVPITSGACTMGCTPPGAPALASATPTCRSVDLAWSAGSGTTSSYNVYRAGGSCPAGALTKIAGPLAGTTYSDTSAAAGVTYAYVVRGACDAPGLTESSDSNCLAAARTLDTTPPSVTPPTPVAVDQATCCGVFGGATSGGSAPLAAFLAAATATDDCGTPTQLSPQVRSVDVTTGTCFEVGATTVTFRFQDGAGNVGTAASSATVLMFADLNLDGATDPTDMVVLRAYINFAAIPGTAPFSAPLGMADLNHDTVVDPTDMVLLRAYFNLVVTCLAP